MVARYPLVAAYIVAAAARVLVVARGMQPAGDTPSYLQAAAALRSAPSAGTPLPVPPFYPAFLAVMPSTEVALFAQALLGALVAPLIGLATARHFGRGAGIVAAATAAVEPSFLQWTPYILTDTLALLVLAAVIERTSAALASPRPSTIALTGALSAVGMITRAALAPVALIVFIVVMLGARRRVLATLAFAAAAAFVIALPTARSALGAGSMTPYLGQGWYLLWAGTHWNEVGRGTVGMDLPRLPQLENATRSEADTYLRDAYLTTVSEKPLEYVGRALRKVLWFWHPAYPEWSLLHRAVSIAYLVPLYALALVGAVLFRRSRFTWLLVGCLLAIQGTIALTIVDYDARYRISAELCLLPLAGVAITRLAALAAARARPQ